MTPAEQIIRRVYRGALAQAATPLPGRKYAPRNAGSAALAATAQRLGLEQTRVWEVVRLP